QTPADSLARPRVLARGHRQRCVTAGSSAFGQSHGFEGLLLAVVPVNTHGLAIANGDDHRVLALDFDAATPPRRVQAQDEDCVVIVGVDELFRLLAVLSPSGSPILEPAWP